jgi:stage V sporulation protein B
MGGMTGTIAGREISTLVPFALAVLTGVVVYVVMVIALRAITLEDMKLFPKGEKIAKMLHIHD